MGPWRAQTSELNHCLRLGQLPFFPLGFMHINISYISSLDPGLNSRTWQGVSFSQCVSAQFGSDCRAAEALIHLHLLLP